MLRLLVTTQRSERTFVTLVHAVWFASDGCGRAAAVRTRPAILDRGSGG